MKKEKTNGLIHKRIVGHYTKHYQRNFGIKPMITWGWIGKKINEALTVLTPDGIEKIIDLYFKNEPIAPGKCDLTRVISQHFINKYAVEIYTKPGTYKNAKEMNDKYFQTE